MKQKSEVQKGTVPMMKGGEKTIRGEKYEFEKVKVKGGMGGEVSCCDAGRGGGGKH